MAQCPSYCVNNCFNDKFALLGQQSTNSSAGKYCDRSMSFVLSIALNDKFALLGQQSTNSSAGKYCDRSMSFILC